MKTLRHILLALLLALNFVSCDPPTIHEEIGVEQVETQSLFTEEESGTVDTENEERDN